MLSPTFNRLGKHHQLENIVADTGALKLLKYTPKKVSAVKKASEEVEKSPNASKLEFQKRHVSGDRPVEVTQEEEQTVTCGRIKFQGIPVEKNAPTDLICEECEKAYSVYYCGRCDQVMCLRCADLCHPAPYGEAMHFHEEDGHIRGLRYGDISRVHIDTDFHLPDCELHEEDLLKHRDITKPGSLAATALPNAPGSKSSSYSAAGVAPAAMGGELAVRLGLGLLKPRGQRSYVTSTTTTTTTTKTTVSRGSERNAAHNKPSEDETVLCLSNGQRLNQGPKYDVHCVVLFTDPVTDREAYGKIISQYDFRHTVPAPPIIRSEGSHYCYVVQHMGFTEGIDDLMELIPKEIVVEKDLNYPALYDIDADVNRLHRIEAHKIATRIADAQVVQKLGPKHHMRDILSYKQYKAGKLEADRNSASYFGNTGLDGVEEDDDDQFAAGYGISTFDSGKLQLPGLGRPFHYIPQQQMEASSDASTRSSATSATDATGASASASTTTDATPSVAGSISIAETSSYSSQHLLTEIGTKRTNQSTAAQAAHLRLDGRRALLAKMEHTFNADVYAELDMNLYAELNTDVQSIISESNQLQQKPFPAVARSYEDLLLQSTAATAIAQQCPTPGLLLQHDQHPHQGFGIQAEKMIRSKRFMSQALRVLVLGEAALTSIPERIEWTRGRKTRKLGKLVDLRLVTQRMYSVARAFEHWRDYTEYAREFLELGMVVKVQAVIRRFRERHTLMRLQREREAELRRRWEVLHAQFRYATADDPLSVSMDQKIFFETHTDLNRYARVLRLMVTKIMTSLNRTRIEYLRLALQKWRAQLSVGMVESDIKSTHFHEDAIDVDPQGKAVFKSIEQQRDLITQVHQKAMDVLENGSLEQRKALLDEFSHDNVASLPLRLPTVTVMTAAAAAEEVLEQNPDEDEDEGVDGDGADRNASEGKGEEWCQDLVSSSAESVYSNGSYGFSADSKTDNGDDDDDDDDDPSFATATRSAVKESEKSTTSKPLAQAGRGRGVDVDDSSGRFSLSTNVSQSTAISQSISATGTVASTVVTGTSSDKVSCQSGTVYERHTPAGDGYAEGIAMSSDRTRMTHTTPTASNDADASVSSAASASELAAGGEEEDSIYSSAEHLSPTGRKNTTTAASTAAIGAALQLLPLQQQQRPTVREEFQAVLRHVTTVPAYAPALDMPSAAAATTPAASAAEAQARKSAPPPLPELPRIFIPHSAEARLNIKNERRLDYCSFRELMVGPTLDSCWVIPLRLGFGSMPWGPFDESNLVYPEGVRPPPRPSLAAALERKKEEAEVLRWDGDGSDTGKGAGIVAGVVGELSTISDATAMESTSSTSNITAVSHNPAVAVSNFKNTAITAAKQNRKITTISAISTLLVEGVDLFISLLEADEESAIVQALQVEPIEKQVQTALANAKLAVSKIVMFNTEKIQRQQDRLDDIPEFRKTDPRYPTAYRERLRCQARIQLHQDNIKKAKGQIKNLPQRVDWFRIPLHRDNTLGLNEVLPILWRVEKHIAAGRNIYFYSSDGHGRAGMLCGLLLGRLYNLHPYEAMYRLQASHDCAQREAARKIPITCPQLPAQRKLITEVLNYTNRLQEGAAHVRTQVDPETLVEQRVPHAVYDTDRRNIILPFSASLLMETAAEASSASAGPLPGSNGAGSTAAAAAPAAVGGGSGGNALSVAGAVETVAATLQSDASIAQGDTSSVASQQRQQTRRRHSTFKRIDSLGESSMAAQQVVPVEVQIAEMKRNVEFGNNLAVQEVEEKYDRDFLQPDNIRRRYPVTMAPEVADPDILQMINSHPILRSASISSFMGGGNGGSGSMASSSMTSRSGSFSTTDRPGAGGRRRDPGIDVPVRSGSLLSIATVNSHAEGSTTSAPAPTPTAAADGAHRSAIITAAGLAALGSHRHSHDSAAGTIPAPVAGDCHHIDNSSLSRKSSLSSIDSGTSSFTATSTLGGDGSDIGTGAAVVLTRKQRKAVQRMRRRSRDRVTILEQMKEGVEGLDGVDGAQQAQQGTGDKGRAGRPLPAELLAQGPDISQLYDPAVFGQNMNVVRTLPTRRPAPAERPHLPLIRVDHTPVSVSQTAEIEAKFNL